ncbi:MAG TPA: hypothetical protein VFV49_02400 [Thermoanaerobaculia bacterium]|nr:hypothetical protein [Thermoanaerobaculia bacterium]
MARSVAIVFADDFSAQLEKLSFHTPVWLADTPANHTAAEDAWQRAVEWPHISVTLFRPQEEWRALLDQIGLQQRTVDAIEVIGASLTNDARTELMAAGFVRFEETGSGFRARR